MRRWGAWVGVVVVAAAAWPAAVGGGVGLFFEIWTQIRLFVHLFSRGDGWIGELLEVILVVVVVLSKVVDLLL